MTLKRCLYCEGEIDVSSDDFEKKGKNYICSFCVEEADKNNVEERNWTDEIEENP